MWIYVWVTGGPDQPLHPRSPLIELLARVKVFKTAVVARIFDFPACFHKKIKRNVYWIIKLTLSVKIKLRVYSLENVLYCKIL